MPVRSLETANKIGNEELLPHLQNWYSSSGNASVSVITQQSDNFLISFFETGEVFSTGEFAAIIGGVAFKATDVVTDNKPAEYMILEDALSGVIRPFTKIMDLEAGGSGFDDGDILWLTSGSPNFTNEKPALVNGKFIQKLGFYFNGKIYPTISSPEGIIL